MRIEMVDGKFVVARGNEYRPQYFSFFVDGDSSSWSKFYSQAHKHLTRADTEDTIKQLRRRQQERRQSKVIYTSPGRHQCECGRIERH